MIRSTWRQLRAFIPRHRISMASLVFASVLSGLAEAGTLVLVVRVALSLTGAVEADLQLPGTSLTFSADQLVLIAALLALSSLVMHAVIARISARLATKVLANSRREAVEAFTRTSWERQSLEGEGALQETVSSLSEKTSLLSIFVATAVVSAVNLTAYLVVALAVDAPSTAIVIAFGGIIFAALRPMSRFTRNRARVSVESNSRFTEDVTRTSSLALDLRVFGVLDTAADQLNELNVANEQNQFRTRFAVRFGSTLYKDVALLFLVGAIGVLLWAGDVALLGFSSVVLLVVRAVTSAQQLQVNLQLVNEQRPNLDALLSRIDVLRTAEMPRGHVPLDDIGLIELHGVEYEYTPVAKALSGIDLRIEPGEAIGIVGPSGGGKSTLVQLLLGLRPPTSGSVTVGGIPMGDIDPLDWARLAALVPQEPRLLEGTVAENIVFLRANISQDDVRDAASRAHVREEIERLPNGFDTVIGPRGGGLSGGQKQRIAIARALVGQPRLLILDEPTSALDGQSEQLIQETLEDLAGRVTLVIVAHRLSTLDSCTRLVVLNKGEIEMSGPPQELLTRPGFYQEVASSMVDQA